jgi:hypothetical protein
MAFLFKGLSHSERGVVGPAALKRHLIAPFESLAIESIERGEGTGGEERVADIADSTFDTPLLVATSWTTRASGEMVVTTEFEKARVKVDSLAMSFENDGLEI